MRIARKRRAARRTEAVRAAPAMPMHRRQDHRDTPHGARDRHRVIPLAGCESPDACLVAVGIVRSVAGQMTKALASACAVSAPIAKCFTAPEWPSLRLRR